MVSLVLGVWWSIQAAKFMQQQQEIIQQKMDFISLATHELGTPLTSILGYAELLNHVNLPQRRKYI
jgi:signal transduction histidine kinase